MGAAKKIKSETVVAKEAGKVSVKKVKEAVKEKSKTKLVLVTDNQLTFDFTQAVAQVSEVSEVSNVVVLNQVQNIEKTSLLDFEGAWNEEEVLATRLYEKFIKFKVQESVSSKFQKSSVASTYINDQTIEEHIQWAILKGIVKWRQHKMIKEYHVLTLPMDANVTELYHAKMKREARIKDILSHFDAEVDKQSSLMVFTEFNQIWNYCFTTFNSKIRNVYRDTVKAKNNDEYIDYNDVEDCLELNMDYSEHFVKDDSRALASREVLRILTARVGEINPAKKDIYLKVFKSHFIDDRDMAATCSFLRIPKHTGTEIKKEIEALISSVRESYEDYLEAA